MDERRSLRVSEAVREELAELVGFELDDPRLRTVTVSQVEVSPDGRHARIKVILEGDEQAQHASLAALEHASHYLRHELASRLQLRRVPELHFEPDRWADADNRVDILLKRARKTRGRNEDEP
jgi:ribosome-binding factor A